MMDVLNRRRVVILALVMLLAFVLRCYRLDAAGLSEDESHKIEAVRAYQQGNYQANLEHPMLMKILVTFSVTTVERLHLPITTETALRLPNVIFGTLTTLVLYLFFTELFGFRIGLLTALLWAININVIMINRVVKEDTLLVFFAWLGYYFYRSAKKLAEEERPRKHWLYRFSGMSFGFMLASKYFPHYQGLNFLYYHLVGTNRWNKPVYYGAFFLACIPAFLLANPVVLLPSTLNHFINYVHEGTQTHHGYWMMGQLYYNDASNPPDGTPLYFYLLVILIKTPLPLLLAFLVGLVEIFRRRDESCFFLKFMFILWLVPFSLFGAKWVRYTLSLMPPFAAIAALGISVGYDRLRAWQKVWWGQSSASRFIHGGLIAAGVGVFLIAPTVSAAYSAPFYSLYVSQLGGGGARVGYYFPQDEFYDLGLREAMQFIAKEAEPQAVIANEAPSVINYYRLAFGRHDISSVVMSDPGFNLHNHTPIYVLVQDGRRYFENIETLNYVEANYKPIKEVRVRGATAVKIYKISESEMRVQGQNIEPFTLGPQSPTLVIR
ncbi:MAG: glycosyltransferase family 39 protein [Acidobacteriota bacterium]